METWKKNVRLLFLNSNFMSVFSYKKPTENNKLCNGTLSQYCVSIMEIWIVNIVLLQKYIIRFYVL
jgi:hypothetical protein